MTLTVPEKIQVRRLILRWKNAIGKEDDRMYHFPKCLENVKVVRYYNEDDPAIVLNGKIALWIATSKEKQMPVIVFEANWFEVPRKHITIEQNVSELLLSNTDEFKERLELQEKLEEIEDDDFIDMYIYFNMLDHGIDIFSGNFLENY